MTNTDASRIYDKLEKLSGSCTAIETTLKFIPTRDDLYDAIAKHSDACTARRDVERWKTRTPKNSYNINLRQSKKHIFAVGAGSAGVGAGLLYLLHIALKLLS